MSKVDHWLLKTDDEHEDANALMCYTITNPEGSNSADDSSDTSSNHDCQVCTSSNAALLDQMHEIVQTLESYKQKS